MKAAIQSVIQTYGTTVELVCGGDSTTCRAFVQPVTSKSWQNMERAICELGEIPRGQYVYLGPASQDITAADWLRCGGKEFVVRRADTLLFGDEALYVWGLLVEKGADDPWNS